MIIFTLLILIKVSDLHSQDGIKFAAIGDYGLALSPWEFQVSNLVKSWNPDFIITLGDNNYPNGAQQTIDTNIGQYYQEFIYPYTGIYGPGATVNRFFPSLGNHDWDTPGAIPYLNYFTLPGNERYYDFIKGPVHFFVIDSDLREPDGVDSSSIQAQWLKNGLENSSSRFKVVYFHNPPYNSGNRHGNSLYMRWPFKTWGASLVMAAHEHVYERFLIDGLTYITNGLGGRSIYGFATIQPGSQVRFADHYGAMLINVNNENMNLKFISLLGQVVDDYNITVPPPVKDIQALELNVPSDNATLTYGTILTPQATFRNNGLNLQNNVLVGYKIIDSTGTEVYNQTDIIDSISTGQIRTITFESGGSMNNPGTYTIKAYSNLIGDEITGNDTLSGTIIILPLLNDIEAFELNVPSDSAILPYGSIITPQAMFKNNGLNLQDNIMVGYKIIDTTGTEVYNQTVFTEEIFPGETILITFASSSSFINPGSYTITAYSNLSEDEITGNDTLSGTITILPLLNDIQASELNVPLDSATLPYGSIVTPQATFRNNGLNFQNNVIVGYKIIDSEGIEFYNHTDIMDSISTGQTRTVTFNSSNSLTIAGTYTIRAYSNFTGDEITGNDTLSGTITILPLLNDIQATELNVPLDSTTLPYGSIITPKAVFRNNGLNVQNKVILSYKIIDSTGIEVYNQTAMIQSISSGEDIKVTFAESSSFTTSGTYKITAYSNLIGDEITENDTLSGTITILPVLLLNITLLPEGKFNVQQNLLMSRDTVKVILRNASYPFEIIDSSTGVIDSINFSNEFTFLTRPSGTFFIVVKHYQCIDTWSKEGGETLNMDSNFFSYDFTTDFAKAFGNNLKQKESKYCIFSGDLNRDQVIDLTDLNLVYNDAVNFANGYLSTDLNGDKFVDLDDINIIYNNSNNFIATITP